MDNNTGIILDIFETTLGIIVIIGVSGSYIPYLGSYFIDFQGGKWKVIGIGTNRIFELSSTKYPLYEFNSVWDCNVSPVNTSKGLIKGSIVNFTK